MDIQAKAIEIATTYGTRVLLALVVWIVGSIVIKHIVKVVEKIFEKTDFDAALETFLESLIGVVLKLLLVIIAISILGVETTSLVALLGAAGLAVGLALQGSLANFAGGALILFFKPFSVGDRIEVSGYSGVVEQIQIFNTILRTPDNRRIIIPNAKVSNEPMVNSTSNGTIGVEFTFGIGYSDDMDKAKSIILEVLKKTKHVHQESDPVIGVRELADSSVNIFTRVFTESENYWSVLFSVQEQVKKEFDAVGISIPFPQQDVHMYNHN